MTYSIVARDPITGNIGVAVQSHFFAVGHRVPWAEAGVGAVATQAFAEVAYGPRGISLMRQGQTAEEALAQLVDEDEKSRVRQVAMVDSNGNTASFTGEGCVQEAGHVADEQVTAQANMMKSARTWEAMIDAYKSSTGDFAERLIGALQSAENVGGDIRGRQSAALVIVGSTRSVAPWDQAILNVRVDDDPEPIHEIRRLTAIGREMNELLKLFRTDGVFSGEFSASDRELNQALATLTALQDALNENLEPSFWKAVLLARAGSTSQAQEILKRITISDKNWELMAIRLRETGMIPKCAFPDIGLQN